MTHSSTVSSSSSKKYRTSYYSRYLFSAGFLALFGVCLLLLAIVALFISPPTFSDWKSASLLGFVSIICLVMAVLGPFGESQTNLVTSHDGIEFQGFGFRVFTSWDNIERLDVISYSESSLEPSKISMAKVIRDKIHLLDHLERQSPENYLEYFVLRKPIRYEKRAWAKRLIRNETQSIPLAAFPSWRNSGLRQDIQRYAPHLLKIDKE